MQSNKGADRFAMLGSHSQAGFFYQNNIAALKVLEMLRPGVRIDHITLENPAHAEHIDDVVVHYADRVEYIQVKWAEDDRTNFTLYGLLTPESDGKAALLRQLADGYASIAGGVPRIVLCSTKGASDRARPSDGLPRSLCDLIREITEPAKSLEPDGSLETLPFYTEYADTLSRMEAVSGLSHADFARFIRCLEFRLGQPPLEYVQDQVRTQLVELGIGREAYDSLLTGIVEWSISGENVARQTVERRLGINDRFVDGVAQVFPVEKAQYVENAKLFADLDESIDRLSGGFILLEGPPGSGKSTALTMYRTCRDDIAVGYYCFIPDEVSFGNRRLERDTFLKHLCIGISQAFPSVEFPDWYSNDYVAKLDRWLHVLSDAGKKAILLVDGLDHVHRQRDHLAAPLTDALSGGALPANIFFLLSSQHLSGLPDSLRRAIEAEPLRHRSMPRFSELQIQEFATKRGVSLDDTELSLVVEKSEGNPLYLHYMCELLRTRESRARRDLLDRLPLLIASNIGSYHEMLYDDLSGDDIAIAILAILAHRREFTTKDTLLELLGGIGVVTNIVAIDLKLKGVRHMLKTREGRSFAVFHNSFREFVREKTAELAPRLDEAMLAHYRNYPDSDEAFRNRYRHLFSLKNYDEILTDCTDAWLRRNWQAFRPLEEMQANLDMAWQAALEKEDFLEFIRVALLLQELGVIERNLESGDCDMAAVLLACGLSAEAVRRIWNGERVQCSMSEYSCFAIEYRLQTGQVLPADIARIAFDSLRKPKSEAEMAQYLRARSLYEPWEKIFAEIEGTNWSNKEEHEHTLTPLPVEEQARIKHGIMTGVIDLLESTRAVAQLYDIAMVPNPPIIRARAAARLASLVLNEGSEADLATACAAVDFSLMSVTERARLVILLETHGRGSLTGHLCDSLPAPELFTPLTNRGTDFGLREETFDLYDRLRAHLLQDDRAYHVYSLGLDAYAAPMQQVFRALLDMASLWRDTIRDSINHEERIRRLKEVFNHLNVPKSVKQASARNHENDPLFISRSIHRLYAYAFEYVGDYILQSEIPHLVQYWLELDRGDGGYKNSETNLSGAKTLYDRHGAAVRDCVLMLLKRGEEQARQDEETSTLVSELFRCVGAYGSCGFKEDASRIWNDIFSCACGVYYRKDYQFNEAIDALTRAHDVAPEKTLDRLAILLARSHPLSGAARGKTGAIAVESLVELAARISPELGLTLLTGEDENIFRERAIRQIVRDAITAACIPLDHLWALVRTMDKWANYTTYDEQTYPAMRDVFSCALKHDDTDLARDVYEFCLRLFEVEKGKPENVQEFIRISREHGHDWPSEWRSKADAATQESGAPTGSTTEREAFDPFPGFICPTYEQLHAASEENFDGMIKLLHAVRKQYRAAERKRAIGDLYRRTGRMVCKGFSESLGDRRLGWTFGRAKKGVRYFRSFQNVVSSLDEDSESLHARELRRLMDGLVEDLALAVEYSAWPDYVLSHIDLDALMLDLASKTWRCEYWFHQKAITPHIQRLLSESSPATLRRWEVFCKEHLSGHEFTEALLAIARRLAVAAPEEAIRLLEKAWDGNKEFFYLSGKERLYSFFDLFFNLDAGRAKRLLLCSFYESYRTKYEAELIYRLDYLTRYAAHYVDAPSADALYELHARYNARLVEGLAEPEQDYAWVAGFTPSMSPKQSVVAYLVGLFDYPEIEVRKLAIDSLAWLVRRDAETIEHVINRSETSSPNIKQHVIMLMHGNAIRDPALVERFKGSLLRWAGIPHFSLRQTIKELLLWAHERCPFLTEEEHLQTEGINVPSLILVPEILTPPPPRARNFVPSSHLVSVLREASIVSEDNDLADRLYERIVRKGWTAESGLEAEGAVRRGHNINTNFDTIEINGPYYQTADEALNELIVEEVEKKAIKLSGVRRLGPLFRLYDPYSHSGARVSRPTFINWLPEDQSEDDFLDFGDLPVSSQAVNAASDEWVWLYQDGHQRPTSDKIRGVTKTTYFHLVAFAVIPSLWEDETTLFSMLRGRKAYYHVRNMYRTEMSTGLSSPPAFGVAGVMPLVGVSFNRFRGQNELSLAVPLLPLIREAKLTPEGNISLNYLQDGYRVVEFLEWMEPYDQDRRRQKPLSAGVGLRIARDTIQKWLSARGLSLAYNIEFYRSTDKYKSEPSMSWMSCEGLLAMNSAITIRTCRFDGDSPRSG